MRMSENAFPLLMKPHASRWCHAPIAKHFCGPGGRYALLSADEAPEDPPGSILYISSAQPTRDHPELSLLTLV